ncbi:MAG: protease HtpX [Bacteriovorax sp.]|nr:protease HtpX [Bacteriovorax sp.]
MLLKIRELAMKRIVLFLAVNILVVATISILISMLGIGSYMTSAGLQYGPLLAFCFLWGMVGSLISLLISKKMAKWMMGVQLITLEGPHKNLVDSVHRLARRAGLTEMPEVGIYQSETMNAFATGPSRNNSLVAVSSGLLVNMDPHEVEGVLAHEVAHIANGDMVTMALVQGVINAFVMFFSRIVAFAITQAMSSKDDRDSRPSPFMQMMLVFALDIIFGILASPIVAWFSRYREFRADRGGADLAGKEKMISALLALSRAYPQLEMVKEEANPNFKSMQISSKDGVMRILSTHPRLSERIARLQNVI